MAINKVFIKTGFLNYLISSGMLFANTINVHRISAATQENIDIPKVVSYRSASCGCCKKWINHLRENGLEVVDNIVEDVSVIKNQYQIPNNLRLCHSAQIANYTIEGHVPIESINKLFREKPNINGIAVPRMPLGSPGMEMHSQESHSHDYEDYKVVSFSKTGKTKIFDKISP
ncbi:MAG: metal-binding protein [Prochlorococcus marinus XMU1428]|nr:metal-binding protein [Prochlorococcus marinus XMU1428]